MCIFNFKHSAPPPHKNKHGGKSFDMKQKSGFTFVEVMLVMVLVSFLI